MCSKGCERPAAPGQNYCRPCHAAYMRDWRRREAARRAADREAAVEYRMARMLAKH